MGIYPYLFMLNMISFGLEFDWASFIVCMNYRFFAFQSTSMCNQGTGNTILLDMLKFCLYQYEYAYIYMEIYIDLKYRNR